MIKAEKKEKRTEVTIGDNTSVAIIQEFVAIYASLSKNLPEELDAALEIIEAGEKEGLFSDMVESED